MASSFHISTSNKWEQPLFSSIFFGSVACRGQPHSNEDQELSLLFNHESSLAMSWFWKNFNHQRCLSCSEQWMTISMILCLSEHCRPPRRTVPGRITFPHCSLESSSPAVKLAGHLQVPRQMENPAFTSWSDAKLLKMTNPCAILRHHIRGNRKLLWTRKNIICEPGLLCACIIIFFW